jgi:hypothetical protein
VSIDTEKTVEAYLAVRTERDRVLKAYEEKDAELKNDMQGLEQLLLGVCSEINADSIKTKYGTVMRRLSERFFCSDWDNFRQFVRDNDAVELLERRIHQGNFRQFMSEHDKDGLPPGVNVTREYGISVRKATNKDQ